jgi:hypothetical protein
MFGSSLNLFFSADSLPRCCLELQGSSDSSFELPGRSPAATVYRLPQGGYACG